MPTQSLRAAALFSQLHCSSTCLLHFIVHCFFCSSLFPLSCEVVDPVCVNFNRLPLALYYSFNLSSYMAKILIASANYLYCVIYNNIGHFPDFFILRMSKFATLLFMLTSDCLIIEPYLCNKRHWSLKYRLLI